jgi:hypothetical protein
MLNPFILVSFTRNVEMVVETSTKHQNYRTRNKALEVKTPRALVLLTSQA